MRNESRQESRLNKSKTLIGLVDVVVVVVVVVATGQVHEETEGNERTQEGAVQRGSVCAPQRLDSPSSSWKHS